MSYTRIKKIIISGTLICALLILSTGMPLGPQGVQHAEAIFGGGFGGAVTVVGDTSSASALRNRIAAVDLGLSSEERVQNSILDPLMWNLTNAVISNMLTSLTQWVNSGFEGSPAFVTDFDSFLRSAADEAAGEFLADSGLDFLCSPFRLNVKIALNIQYQQARNGGATAGRDGTQCTLSQISGNVENFLNGTFSDGGWGSWFELTQGPTNDPNKAFLEARERMRIELITNEGRQTTELAANDFFLPVEICEEGISVQGSIENCTTSTLGTIIEDQLNASLSSSRDRLVMADEFDELVGALLAQLANQAVMGVNGLLGMGGTSYASNTYGSGGGSSYLDAVRQETIAAETTGSSDQIARAIEKEEEYIDLLNNIIDLIDELETSIALATETYGSCFNVKMSSDLTDMRDDAEAEINTANTNILILTILYDEYAAAQTSLERSKIIEEFVTFQSEGASATDLGIVQADLSLEYIIPDLIKDVQSDMSRAINQCTDDN